MRGGWADRGARLFSRRPRCAESERHVRPAFTAGPALSSTAPTSCTSTATSTRSPRCSAFGRCAFRDEAAGLTTISPCEYLRRRRPLGVMYPASSRSSHPQPSPLALQPGRAFTRGRCAASRRRNALRASPSAPSHPFAPTRLGPRAWRSANTLASRDHGAPAVRDVSRHRRRAGGCGVPWRRRIAGLGEAETGKADGWEGWHGLADDG